MSNSHRIEPLVTVRQAASVLGMAPSSLYRLAKSCRIPSYAVGARGRGVRIDIEAAKAALLRSAEE
ncbi:helix-turn-helix domain-containing protein [Nitrospira sp. KM1]|uniref:helix-turn-helix domain-containing protein n=1 Tax=Nitrospira sp. KM1 TaxID=1936990 RepID=UPI0015657CFC|nr:helix-turn-helix domain-containing protein [Nitrospira sp. KM1]